MKESGNAMVHHHFNCSIPFKPCTLRAEKGLLRPRVHQEAPNQPAREQGYKQTLTRAKRMLILQDVVSMS